MRCNNNITHKSKSYNLAIDTILIITNNIIFWYVYI